MSQGASSLDGAMGNGLKVAERLNLLDRVYHGSERAAGGGARETHQTTEAMGFLSPLPYLTFVVVVPYRHAKTRGELLLDGDGSPAGVDAAGKGSAQGVGDVSLLARYTFFARDRPSGTSRAAAFGGVKFPTGRTDARTDSGERYLDSHLQPGTGSTDYLIGFSLSHALDRLSLSASVLGTLTRDGLFGDTRHRFGNSWNYDLTAKYRVLPGGQPAGSARCFAVLGVSGKAFGKEQHDGETQANTGGHTLYVAPGLQVTVGPHWVFDLSYQAPVFQNLGGTQLGETSQLVGAVGYRF